MQEVTIHSSMAGHPIIDLKECMIKKSCSISNVKYKFEKREWIGLSRKQSSGISTKKSIYLVNKKKMNTPPIL